MIKQQAASQQHKAGKSVQRARDLRFRVSCYWRRQVGYVAISIRSMATRGKHLVLDANIEMRSIVGVG